MYTYGHTLSLPDALPSWSSIHRRPWADGAAGNGRRASAIEVRRSAMPLVCGLVGAMPDAAPGAETVEGMLVRVAYKSGNCPSMAAASVSFSKAESVRPMRRIGWGRGMRSERRACQIGRAHV